MSEIRVVARYEKMGEPYIRVRLSDGRVIREHIFIMEQAIGRRLQPGEVVHHIDEDKRNNALANLEIKSRSRHSSDHRPDPKMEDLVCPACGESFRRRLSYLRHRRKGGLTVFFCSNRCSRIGASPSVPHGTRSGYSYHRCRCDECKRAHREGAQRYRKKVKGALAQ